MIGPVQIANAAIRKVGGEPILSLEDNVKSARLLKAMFETVRDQEIAAYRWKFAIQRAELPALADAPVFGYSKAYPLPSDFLALVQINDIPWLGRWRGKPLWSIEARQILTDFPAPLRIRYLSRITDYGLYPPLFVEVLACKLAIEACESLTQSNTKKQNLWQEYEQAVSRARTQDAIEKAPDIIPDGSWLQARESGEHWRWHG